MKNPIATFIYGGGFQQLQKMSGSIAERLANADKVQAFAPGAQHAVVLIVADGTLVLTGMAAQKWFSESDGKTQ